VTAAAPDQLLDALKDAHAMEVHVFETLETMIGTTRDPETLDALDAHRRQTHGHAQRLQERLGALGEQASSAKDLGGTLRAAAKGFSDQLRSAKPSKNARDLYAAQQMQVAAYAMLELLGERVADVETSALARAIRRDEEAMASWLADRWERFVDLTLASSSGAP